VTFLDRQLTDPVRWRRMKRGFVVVLAALALAEAGAPLIIETDPAHFRFEDLPAWGCLYGLTSCLLIIIVSKALGKLWLTRPERYYDR
jgi:hypothetical protein